MTKIKICGLTRKEDVAAANELMPDYVGFVFAKSRRQVSEEQAALLQADLNPAICPVGVFVNADKGQILRLAERGIIRMVQLHGQETPKQAARLKQALAPLGVGIIKAIRMEPGVSIREWLESEADYLLLDAGSGGTGKTFDHELLSEIGPIKKPWFLAGGMNPDNVSEAIRRFSPYGIDTSSGVETDGRKDREKMEKMVRAVRLRIN